MSSADTGHATGQAVNVATARHATCVLPLYLRMSVQSFLYKLYSEDPPYPTGKPPILLVPRSLYTSLRSKPWRQTIRAEDTKFIHHASTVQPSRGLSPPGHTHLGSQTEAFIPTVQNTYSRTIRKVRHKNASRVHSLRCSQQGHAGTFVPGHRRTG